MTPDEALARLAALRAEDPPTHGGRVLSYVYDPGRPELDRVAAEAARLVQHVNGLDPTTFRSVAAVERDLVRMARRVLGGDDAVVGSVTSGGTESCLLAVKTARDAWRAHRAAGGEGDRVAGGEGDSAAGPEAASRARVVAPTTVHPAFRKAAHYLDVELVEVPVDPRSGTLPADRLLAAVDDAPERTALVVVSAPGYPYGVLDPVAEVAAGARTRGVGVHVDACLGGWVLPWWPDDVAPWDLAVPGVVSLSADLHKYGYAPKGVSVLLQRGRDRLRHQAWATKGWPGYPVVNPTVLGSRSAGPAAAAWAVAHVLGDEGFGELVADTARATRALRDLVGDVEGLRVVGDPVGPAFAVATDEGVPADRRVDPFTWVDAVRRRGWVLQMQPALAQADGTALPRTAHLTVTPVTATVLDGPEGLGAALRAGADEVRGRPPAAADPAAVAAVAGGLPEDMATVMATLEALPADVVEPLLADVLLRTLDPDA